MSLRWLNVSSGLAALLVFTGLWIVAQDRAERPAAGPLSPLVKEGTGAAADTQVWRELEAPARPPAARPPGSSTNDATGWTARFEAATDLRAFVQQALHKPEAGGLFYALRALSECRQWTDVPDELNPSTTADRSHAELFRRAVAVDLSRRRCAAFGPQELADAEVERLTQLGESGADPLLAAYQGWVRAVEQGTLDALVPALERALRVADPALMEWVAVAGRNFLSPPRGSDPTATATPLQQQAAWAHVACALGADCSRPERGPASPCIATGRCAAGSFANVASRTAGAEAAALERELQVLVRAIRARDARMLLEGGPTAGQTAAGPR